LLLGLAPHERLALRKAVGQKNAVVFADGVVRRERREKIDGNDARALMQELIKGVLPVGSRLAPDDGARGVVVDDPTLAVDALAVALHVALLEVRGKRCRYWS